MGSDFSYIGRRCERAVVNAYRDLRARGVPDLNAFMACATLYRVHHPEASIGEARRLVAEWIDQHVVGRQRSSSRSCGDPED